MFRLTSIVTKVPVINSIKTKLSNVQLPKRLRGGMIENSLSYLKNVFNDYKMVYLDTIQDIRDRPVRAGVIGYILLSSAYLMKHNPNENDYVDQLIDSSNKLSRVPETTRKNVSYEYLRQIYDYNNQKVLRYQSFGLFTVVYRVNYGPELDLYQAQCNYLKPSWRTLFTERIIDVGILNRFHWMEHMLQDYDINDEEF